MEDIELIKHAEAVREKAHAPYSGFRVGAALLGKSGRVYKGCNVESSSFGLTICAERNAVAAAVAQGEKGFRAIAISTENGASPCGACRQVLWEICGDIPVILVDQNGTVHKTSTGKLLPLPFDENKLKQR